MTGAKRGYPLWKAQGRRPDDIFNADRLYIRCVRCGKQVNRNATVRGVCRACRKETG